MGASDLHPITMLSQIATQPGQFVRIHEQMVLLASIYQVQDRV